MYLAQVKNLYMKKITHCTLKNHERSYTKTNKKLLNIKNTEYAPKEQTTESRGCQILLRIIPQQFKVTVKPSGLGNLWLVK